MGAWKFRNQATLERFNHTFAKHLFGQQYTIDMLLPPTQQSTTWVKRLPNLVATLNNEVT